MAPLSLPGISFACYDLQVQNDLEQTVWSRGTAATFPADTGTVCSNTFGNGAGGDITYIGPCDATEADTSDGKVALNQVNLWVDGLYGESGADIGSYRNPCPWPAGCALAIECQENADVLVSFDLTIMRNANQGFFDIGVNFEDVFCSAKADTCYAGDPGTPIEFLAHSGRDGATDADGDGRFRTGNSALACTAGPGTTSTVLRMSPVTIACAGGIICDLDPAGLAGNNYATCTGGARVAYGVYRGIEQLACDGGAAGSCQKLYWNLAVNLEDLAAAGFSDCAINYDATATTGTTPTFSTTNPGVLVGPSVTYPSISYAGPLLTGTAPSCGTHGLDDGTVVTTRYLKGCDESVGAPACTLPALCNTLENQAGVAVATACGAPANREPMLINSIENQSATTDQPFELIVPGNVFSDPDGDNLTLSATVDGGSLPSWLTFDAGAGMFAGTPTPADIGQLVITLTATDPSGASVTTSFNLDVVQANRPPDVSPVEFYVTVQEGGTATLDLSAYVTDPDGDPLTITSFYGGAFATTIDLVATFAPISGDAGVTYSFGFEVSDGFHWVYVNGSVEVTVGNRAPECIPFATVSGTKYSNFTFDVATMFSEPDGDPLTYSLRNYGPFPTGTTLSGSTLNINPTLSTGQFDQPNSPTLEYWYIEVIATDPGGLTSEDPNEFPCLVTITARY